MGRYTCSDCAYMDTNVKSNGKYRCENSRKSGYDEVSATMIACNSFCDCLYSRRSSSDRAKLYQASKDKGWWIMSAIMEILDLEDKEVYLSEFAYLKKHMLPLLHGGNEWIKDYDRFGPIIAKRMHEEKSKVEFAAELFANYIFPFHQLFNEGDIDAAFDIYQKMFRALKLRYGLEPMPKCLSMMTFNQSAHC